MEDTSSYENSGIAMHIFLKKTHRANNFMKTILSNDAQQVTASRYLLTFYNICRLEANNFYHDGMRAWKVFVIEHLHYPTHFKIENFPDKLINILRRAQLCRSKVIYFKL